MREGAILDTVVRENLIERGPFRERPERREWAMQTPAERAIQKQSHNHQDPRTGKGLLYSTKSEVASVAGVDFYKGGKQ